MFNLVIKDSDFSLENGELKDPRKRLGARGIVENELGQIAVFNKRVKNEFKMPGGGIDGNEDPIEAFKREVLEETGCEVKEIEQIGTIEEYKFKENFYQKSFVFKCKVLENTQRQELTQKEKDEDATLLWLDPNQALEKLENCISNLKPSAYDNVYRSRFMVKRDIEILKHYLHI